jgi:hypothetical protein
MGALGLATSLELRVTCHLAFFHDEVLATGAAAPQPPNPARLWGGVRLPRLGAHAPLPALTRSAPSSAWPL